MTLTAKTVANLSLRIALPAFLVLAVLFGGASHEGYRLHAILAVLASIGLSLMFILSDPKWVSGSTGLVVIFGSAAIGISLFQIIPLPFEFWKTLPDRDNVIKGYELIGGGSPSVSISFSYQETLRSVIAFLPPLFVFAGIALARHRGVGLSIIMWLIPCIAAASIFLGLGQMVTGPDSPLYLFDRVNAGAPTGFFSNVNHQGTLCLIAIPLLVALAGRHRRVWNQSDQTMAITLGLGILGFVLLLGLIATGSAAAYGILLPLLFFSAFLIREKRTSLAAGWPIFLAVGVMLSAAALYVFTSPFAETLGLGGLGISGSSRTRMFSEAAEIISNHYIWGTGLGTFEGVYRLYEDAEMVTNTFVNHVHSDYLEWTIEMGLPGIVLLGLFLIWWARHFVLVWITPKLDDRRFRRAASLGTLAVALHSIVDYPLRTPAISILAAACLAIMITSPRTVKATEIEDEADEDTTSKARHLDL